MFTALVVLPGVLISIWLGGLWFLLLVEVLALLGLREFYRLSRRVGARPLPFLAFPALAALIATAQLTTLIPFLITVAVILFLVPLLTRVTLRPAFIRDWSHTAAGFFYLGLLSLAPPLRALDHGMWWVLLGLVSVIASDSAAYFTGRALGRHPLAPALSAGKTWEGSIGGLVAAVVVAGLLATLSPLALPLWQALLLGPLVGVLAQLGDLTESALKRASGVKDTGRLLPGHGGALDRLDSIVFALAGVYHFAVWLAK